MDGKSLRHPLRRLQKLRTSLGKKLRASDLRIWRNTTVPSTTTQETSKSTPTNAEMHLARNSFRNRRKLRRNGNRRTKCTNSTETTPRLQIRPVLLNKVSGTPWAPRRNTYNPSFATLLDTPTIVREETIYARLRTTDERDGRHCRGTRNKTTTRYVTSTASVDIDVKFTTTTG